MKTIGYIGNVLLLVGMLLMSLVGVGQNIIEIGDNNGTGNKYYAPIGTLYNYSITEQLYTTDEIGISGIIESISFHYLGTDSKDFPINVYMKQVSNVDLSTGISLVDAELVFSGTYSVNGSDWFTINLDNPFVYDGTSNLLIGINKGFVQWYGGGNWQTSSMSNMEKYSWDDSNGYDLTTIPSISTNRPDIRMEIITDECLLSVPYYQDFDCANIADLSCWGVVDNNSDGYSWTRYYNGNNIAHSGDKYFYSSSYEDIDLNPDDWFVSPNFYIPNDGNEYFLKWWTKQDCSSWNDFYRVYDGIVNGNYVTLGTDISGQITSSTSWEEHVLSLLNYAGQTSCFIFRHFETDDGCGLFLDDFSIDYCVPPSDLVVSNITATSATFNWTAFGVSEFSMDGINWESTDGDIRILNNLTSDTEYTVYIRNDCGYGKSQIISSSFVTESLCKPLGDNEDVNTYLPTYIFYNYSLTQQIYTSNEIGQDAGTLSYISFYCTSTPNSTRTLDIYM